MAVAGICARASRQQGWRHRGWWWRRREPWWWWLQRRRQQRRWRVKATARSAPAIFAICSQGTRSVESGWAAVIAKAIGSPGTTKTCVGADASWRVRRRRQWRWRHQWRLRHRWRWRHQWRRVRHLSAPSGKGTVRVSNFRSDLVQLKVFRSEVFCNRRRVSTDSSHALFTQHITRHLDCTATGVFRCARPLSLFLPPPLTCSLAPSILSAHRHAASCPPPPPPPPASPPDLHNLLLLQTSTASSSSFFLAPALRLLRCTSPRGACRRRPCRPPPWRHCRAAPS